MRPDSIEDYRTFINVKRLPTYRIKGREVWVPDEYASKLGLRPKTRAARLYTAPSWMFDYQAAITETALKKQKYAVFADCGLGKTGILLEFARVVSKRTRKPVLIVSPLNVIPQTLSECTRFFPSLEIEDVHQAGLQQWLSSQKSQKSQIGIVNYESLNAESIRSNTVLGGLILDESSMLKSHYGKWAQCCLDLGKGVEYKLCCTGTPAPNDRIEYANHAVFLDKFTTVNAFLATFFVNRGQTDNRWELKPHALRPFYRSLSDWCIFLTDPSTYGWHDNTESIPPIYSHVHEVPLTDQQRDLMRELTGELFVTHAGGITKRSKLGQLGKGIYNGRPIDTHKPAFIKQLVGNWQAEESTIIWCLYNEEQKSLEQMFPEAVSIIGATKYEKRIEGISQFQSGEKRVLISKPRILGFGLNLQVATRQVFSGLQDSYESYYQAVKRSNRYGSTKPLNVHIPVTEFEEPMVQNVLRKSDRVQRDTAEQEALFRGQIL